MKLRELLPAFKWISGGSTESTAKTIQAVKVFPQALSAIWAMLINADGRVIHPEEIIYKLLVLNSEIEKVIIVDLFSEYCGFAIFQINKGKD